MVVKEKGAVSKHGKRLYSQRDMQIIRHDLDVINSINKREHKSVQIDHIIHCGCGAEGCFLYLQKQTNNESTS